MKKRILLIIPLIVILMFVSFFCYYEYTDTFEFFFTQGPVDDDLYIECISCAGDNLVTKSKRNADEMIKFSEENRKIGEVHKKYASGEYKEPIRIDATIEIENGKTIYTYSGTVTTKDDEQLEYYHSFSIDCVPTYKIPDVFKSVN